MEAMTMKLRRCIVRQKLSTIRLPKLDNVFILLQEVKKQKHACKKVVAIETPHSLEKHDEVRKIKE